MPRRAISVSVLVFGIALGAGGLALGAYLASGNNGWTSALMYSVVGVIGAPLAAFSWGSRRSKRRQVVAGIALALGLLASMGLMLELTQELSGLKHAWSQVPWGVAGWILIWLAWQAIALARLLLSHPPRTRGRLSSRRGDRGR